MRWIIAAGLTGMPLGLCGGLALLTLALAVRLSSGAMLRHLCWR